MKKRILFFAETVTMAHLARPLGLMGELDPTHFEIFLAAGIFFEPLKTLIPKHVTAVDLTTSVKPPVFLSALSKGTLPYDTPTVRAQVQEDVALIKRLKPDIVIGDFRNSLIISSRVTGVPYVNVTNLTWHPQAKIPLQVPDVKIARILGERLAKILAIPIFKIKKRQLFHPFQVVARENGLEMNGTLDELYTSGDFVFYADLPEIIKTPPLSNNQFVIGPVLTSVPSFETVPDLIPGQANVVVALGSSGLQSLTEKIVRALVRENVNLYVADNGIQLNVPQSKNLYVTKILPLEKVLPKADLLIFNGGSPTGYMGLSFGVPLLAIPSNLDQFNFSYCVGQKGASSRVRCEKVSEAKILQEVRALLTQKQVKESAVALQNSIMKTNAPATFAKILREMKSLA